THHARRLSSDTRTRRSSTPRAEGRIAAVHGRVHPLPARTMGARPPGRGARALLDVRLGLVDGGAPGRDPGGTDVPRPRGGEASLPGGPRHESLRADRPGTPHRTTRGP